jgi:hypothetical protein
MNKDYLYIFGILGITIFLLYGGVLGIKNKNSKDDLVRSDYILSIGQLICGIMGLVYLVYIFLFQVGS